MNRTFHYVFLTQMVAYHPGQQLTLSFQFTNLYSYRNICGLFNCLLLETFGLDEVGVVPCVANLQSEALLLECGHLHLCQFQMAL